MGTLADQAPKLLDFTQRLDINLLDNVVGCMYSGMGDQVRQEFNKVISIDDYLRKDFVYSLADD